MNKFLKYLTLIIISVSCKVNEPVVNRPPGDFKVNVTLKKDGKSVSLNWENSLDPDGDEVTYTVIFGDTLIKNITETSFEIKDLDYELKKEGQVIAFDSKKLKTSVSFLIETGQNKAPNNFSVISNLERDGKTISLKWGGAIDPNGDEVRYDVLLGKDTLIKGLSDTVFVIKTLDYDYTGAGYVIASDIKGLKTSVGFNVKTSEDLFSIKDREFESFLVDHNFDSDHLVDGKMLKKDAEKIKRMEFFGRPYLIDDISTFRHFKNLEVLYFNSNNLKNIKFENLPKLNYLFINESYSLETIDLTSCNSLRKIYLISTSTKNLFLPLDGKIEYLELEANKMEVLDLCKLNSISFFLIKDNQYSNEKYLKYIYVKDLKEAINNLNWKKESEAEYKICN